MRICLNIYILIADIEIKILGNKAKINLQHSIQINRQCIFNIGDMFNKNAFQSKAVPCICSTSHLKKSTWINFQLQFTLTLIRHLPY